MSSEDDDVVLQKHRGKFATGLARPATDRRQSKESQSSKLSQVVASSRQSRDVQPSRKSAAATAAPPDDDSDDDAHMLQKHQNKLLTHVKVGRLSSFSKAQPVILASLPLTHCWSISGTGPCQVSGSCEAER